MLRTVSVQGCSSRCEALCIPLIAAGATLLVAGCSATGSRLAPPALAVLGGVASSAAFAAGQVYRQMGVPAITGAASEARVTDGNDWYFRLFKDAGGQGRFLRLCSIPIRARKIAVIRETGTAGEEFASALRDRARTQDIVYRERRRIYSGAVARPIDSNSARGADGQHTQAGYCGAGYTLC